MIYHVDSEQVAASAANVAATASAIRDQVAAMMANLLALQDTWGGVAAANFADCTSQWRITQAQVEASLDSISTQLATAASVYSEAEAQSMALFH